jgi:hypothetical protein
MGNPSGGDQGNLIAFPQKQRRRVHFQGRGEAAGGVGPWRVLGEVAGAISGQAEGRA